jgi:hypothetical protein
MTNETKRLIREGFGAIEDELRQRRAVDTEIVKRLDVLIKLAGGTDAKATAIREDLDAHIGDAFRHAVAR